MNEIKVFRSVNHLTQDELAAYLGTGKSFISLVETGRNTLSQEKFSKLLNNNKGWDISMLSIDTAKRSDNYEASIPLIPIEAMAGFGTGEQTVLEYECDRYVIPMFHEAEFLIPVKGSSMIPKYNSGDIVACKKLSLNDLFFQWNKVYVLDTAQGALIKRVKKGSDTNHITCISDNINYEPFELSMSQINSVAIVIGVVRLE